MIKFVYFIDLVAIFSSLNISFRLYKCMYIYSICASKEKKRFNIKQLVLVYT